MYTSKYKYKHEKKENEVIKIVRFENVFKERGGGLYIKIGHLHPPLMLESVIE